MDNRIPSQYTRPLTNYDSDGTPPSSPDDIVVPRRPRRSRTTQPDPSKSRELKGYISQLLEQEYHRKNSGGQGVDPSHAYSRSASVDPSQTKHALIETERKLASVLAQLRQTIVERDEASLEARRVTEELKLWKAQLTFAQQEINRAQEIVNELDQERAAAEASAAQARDANRALVLERDLEKAKEMGRREGFELGLKKGKMLVDKQRRMDMRMAENEDDILVDADIVPRATRKESGPRRERAMSTTAPVRAPLRSKTPPPPRPVPPRSKSTPAGNILSNSRSPVPMRVPSPTHSPEEIRPIPVRNPSEGAPSTRSRRSGHSSVTAHSIPPDGSYVPTRDDNDRINLPPPHILSRPASTTNLSAAEPLTRRQAIAQSISRPATALSQQSLSTRISEYDLVSPPVVDTITGRGTMETAQIVEMWRAANSNRDAITPASAAREASANIPGFQPDPQTTQNYIVNVLPSTPPARPPSQPPPQPRSHSDSMLQIPAPPPPQRLDSTGSLNRSPIQWIRRRFEQTRMHSTESTVPQIAIEPPSHPPSVESPNTSEDINPVLLTPDSAMRQLEPEPEEYFDASLADIARPESVPPSVMPIPSENATSYFPYVELPGDGHASRRSTIYSDVPSGSNSRARRSRRLSSNLSYEAAPIPAGFVYPSPPVPVRPASAVPVSSRGTRSSSSSSPSNSSSGTNSSSSSTRPRTPRTNVYFATPFDPSFRESESRSHSRFSTRDAANTPAAADGGVQGSPTRTKTPSESVRSPATLFRPISLFSEDT